MRKWFIKMAYLEAVIEKEIKKIRFSKQGQNSKRVEKEVQFAVAYHPLRNMLTSIISRYL